MVQADGARLVHNLIIYMPHIPFCYFNREGLGLGPSLPTFMIIIVLAINLTHLALATPILDNIDTMTRLYVISKTSACIQNNYSVNKW